MADQIYIGNFPKGMRNDVLPFNIDNNTFSNLFNSYVWRGRARRKRGTIFLGQLERQIVSVLDATPPANWQYGQINLVGGAANLITDYGLEPTSVISPGTISLTVGANVYTEPTNMAGNPIPDGTLVGTPAGSGTINYSTGDITISGGGASAVTGTFSYFPELPIMALADFSSSISSLNYPTLLAFDTKYSYGLNQITADVFFYSTSYYKNTNNPVVWTGQDFQLFWTTNYSGALWATNNKPGLNMVFGTYVAGSGTNVITFTFEINSAPITNLVAGTSSTGDQLWFNEWDTGGSNINGLTGFVSTVVNAVTGTYQVTFVDPQTVSGTGYTQLLTNSVPGQDGIKWYDGDPTSQTGIPIGNNLGWANFSPPLSATLNDRLDNLPPGLYYLAGALAMLPFKDRLLFFSPYVQTSTGVPIQLRDTVLWSWVGTPYYNTLLPSSNVQPQISDPRAWYVDQTGLGGYLPAGIPQPITTIGNNEDVILIGFGGDGRKTRFVYTGNDLQPFLFFSINSELPSSSPFSVVSVDKGMIDVGQFGICLTDQQSSQRIDLDIPDSVFSISNLDNGLLRVNGIRDFFREWMYFAYPYDDIPYRFPTQTFLYNYRDNTWAVFYENFTAHGNFRSQIKNTWATIGEKFGSWSNWREPWNSPSQEQLFPSIIAGNPQGYVLIKASGTGEGQSGTINAITDNVGNAQITSYNHCVMDINPSTKTGDYLLFDNTLGVGNYTITGITFGVQTVLTITFVSPITNNLIVGQSIYISGILWVDGADYLNGNTYVIANVTATTITIDVNSTLFNAYDSGGNVSSFNGLIGKVIDIVDDDNFVVDIPTPSGTYLGLGRFSRLCQPIIQTKQFNFYWEQGRKVRLGVQKYLLDTTADGQITVEINLSQDPNIAWNSEEINPPPNSLIYSQLVYTCPESSNLGLTPFNTNLQMPNASEQFQIWHRYSTSLQGDSVQLSLTLNDAQMRSRNYSQNEITLHGVQLTVHPGPLLA